MKKAITILFLLTIISLSGCSDFPFPVSQNNETTLNADGTGKVDYEVVFEIYHINDSNFPVEPDPRKTKKHHQLFKETVKDLLNLDEGLDKGLLDTWQNVSYRITDANQLHFKGTAFFNDVNACSAMFSMSPFLYYENDNGDMTLEIQFFEMDQDQTTLEINISDEEVAQQIKEAKLEYKQMLDEENLLIFQKINYNTIIHLPGKITEISNFKKLDSNSVQIKFKGSKFLKLFDTIMADDKLMEKNVRMGYEPLDYRYLPQMNKILFGHDGPVKVTFKNKFQLFNYNKEMSAAKENYNKMLKDLNLESDEPPN